MATVLLVPRLPNAPELLALAMAVWVGLCLSISLRDRTPRSYVSMLADDTAAPARFDGAVRNALREVETSLTVHARELDRHGQTDFFTTLDARRLLASAISALTASGTELAGDQLALFLVLGGGERAHGHVLADLSNHLETRK